MLATAGTVTKRPDKVASQATICPALSLSCAEIDRCPHVIFSSEQLLPDMVRDPDRFTDVMLGCVWIKDRSTQVFIVDFLDQLRAFRNSLLLQSDPI